MNFDKNSNIKILIIRLSSIGDVILTSKMIRNLRMNFPKAAFSFVTNAENDDLLKFNPRIDNLYLYHKNFSIDEKKKFIEKIESDNIRFDFIIDLQNNNRSKEIANHFNSPIYQFDKRRFYKLALVYLKKNKNNKFDYIPDLYCRTFNQNDFIVDDNGLEIWLENDNKTLYLPEIRSFAKKEKYKISFAPGAHFKTKRWLTEYFIELINSLKNSIDFESFLVGGNQDREICSRINAETEIIDLSGNTSLIETTGIIDSSDLLITNDTSVMHIAAARRTPVVSFWGATVPEFGFAPYKCKNLLLQEDLWCRPCSHIGRNYCPLLHFKCMKMINPKAAEQKILDFFKEIYR